MFTLESGFVGRIIGKKGENINRIRDEYEVKIFIEDPPEHDRMQQTTITVSGPSADAVRKAREEMEFVTIKVPIDHDQVGWIVGKGYQNLQDISKKADLQYARFDDGTRDRKSVV